MSTRGAWGIKKGDKIIVQYNHFDSYPTGLGEQIVEDLNEWYKDAPEEWIKRLNEVLDEVEVINEEKTPQPTEEQLQYIRDEGIKFDENYKEWFSVLSELQGRVLPYLKGFKYFLDWGVEWLNDSLFCEWAYIFNLDNNTLEINGVPYPIKDLSLKLMQKIEKEAYDER